MFVMLNQLTENQFVCYHMKTWLPDRAQAPIVFSHPVKCKHQNYQKINIFFLIFSLNNVLWRNRQGLVRGTSCLKFLPKRLDIDEDLNSVKFIHYPDLNSTKN